MKRIDLGIVFGLVLLALIAFWRVGEHDFVSFDDDIYVSSNEHVLGGLTWENVRWAWTTHHGANWHPLTWMSLMVDAHWLGPSPGGFHRVNMILHALNSAFVFLALRSLGAATWPSALTAALFCIHPLHVESVAWVAERKDLLSTLFGLLALVAYGCHGRQLGNGWLAATLFLWTMSLLAKQMLVTFPFLLLLLDWWPLGRWRPSEAASTSKNTQLLLWEKLPFLVIAILFSIIVLKAQSSGDAVRSFESYPLSARLNNALVSYVRYLGKTFWPMGLVYLYPHPGPGLPRIQALAASALVSLVSLGVFVLRRKRPYLFTGWFWYLGTLVPVIGIIQVGDQAMADRYTYFPLIGIFIAISFGLCDWAGGVARRQIVVAVASILVLAVLTMLTRRQVDTWRDSGALYRHAIEVLPNNEGAHNNLGNLLAQRGSFQQAIHHYRRALAVRPDAAEWNGNLATSLAAIGKYDEAIEHYERAIQKQPEWAWLKNNLAWIYAACPDPRFRDGKKARLLSEDACQLTNFEEPAYLDTLAASHAELGLYDEAVKIAEKARSMAITAGNRDLAAQLDARLALYRAGQPYRDPPPLPSDH